ncbi:A-kinase anchor protein 14 [Leucoraja erinacea]|uniref:A-kinase anchor protein 14 n=1 Tax=Leucoraja erinaceus TaxID=7782 RepID=UPI002456F913|nr:A-kinase anchor protein 14 [Leucoraja erinacea]XP_055500048.1 A-kinase anchor protein 14 [Leucoraja erinacea]
MDDDEYYNLLLKKQAKAIIKQVLENAKRYVEQLLIKEGKGEYRIPNIEWVPSKDFTVTIGAKQIEEYVSKTWEFKDCWLHCLDYLSEEELEYQIHHHYRVRWSIPTRRKPIPRATASSYFIIEISKVKPPTFPVEVYFFFESNRLLHRPGQSRFKEKWLKDIIESKILLMEEVNF